MTLKVVNEREYKRRLKKITDRQKLGIDNELKVEYSTLVLKKVGKIFNVLPPAKKNRRLKVGSCYGNAIRKMREGYEYVEGVITDKETRIQISHAWNVDSEGFHVDFTIMETGKYEYNGIIIPSDVLYEVGSKNGHIWYCCLPYIEVK